MAKIIKGTEPPTPLKRRSPILKGSEYQEQQDIQALYAEAQTQQVQMTQQAKQQAIESKQKGVAEGAQQAFSEASQLAFELFCERAQTCLALKGPLKQITDEISKKILGSGLTLPQAEQDKILDSAIRKIRARHKIKLQTASPEKFSDLSKFPEFEVEISSEIEPGSIKVITDSGSSLWDEQSAIAHQSLEKLS